MNRDGRNDTIVRPLAALGASQLIRARFGPLSFDDLAPPIGGSLHHSWASNIAAARAPSALGAGIVQTQRRSVEYAMEHREQDGRSQDSGRPEPARALRHVQRPAELDALLSHPYMRVTRRIVTAEVPIPRVVPLSLRGRPLVVRHVACLKQSLQHVHEDPDKNNDGTTRFEHSNLRDSDREDTGADDRLNRRSQHGNTRTAARRRRFRGARRTRQRSTIAKIADSLVCGRVQNCAYGLRWCPLVKRVIAIVSSNE